MYLDELWLSCGPWLWPASPTRPPTASHACASGVGPRSLSLAHNPQGSSYLLEAVLSWVQAQWLPLTYGRVAEAQHGTAACPGLHSSWAPSAACCSEVLSPLPCAAQQVQEHLPGGRPSLSTVST